MWNIKEFKKQLSVPVIGMVHLCALPGSPDYNGAISSVEKTALADAEALVAGGVGALMMENYFDVPFYRDKVPPITIASMTKMAVAIKEKYPSIPLGINVLRNDAEAALSIAAVVSAEFIRVNVLSGSVVTDQGLIEADAASILRLREHIAPDVAIFSDLLVKHAAPLVKRDLTDEAGDLRYRSLADAIILSGSGTGAKADSSELRLVRNSLSDCPILIGSGMSIDNLKEFSDADGFIVGSSLKSEGADGNLFVDSSKVSEFVNQVRILKGE